MNRIVVIAGPNGAGKTTFAREFLPHEAARVAQGGHNVPEADIRRRFLSGLKNFHEVYKQAVDTWTLYDNSGTIPKVVKRGERT